MPKDNKQSERMTQEITATIRAIPAGCVASYGQLAEMAGYPGRARLVGRILRESDEPLPWHRVLRSNRQSAFPAGSELHQKQVQRLLDEGVLFISGRVPKKTFEWKPDLDALLWGPLS